MKAQAYGWLGLGLALVMALPGCGQRSSSRPAPLSHRASRGSIYPVIRSSHRSEGRFANGCVALGDTYASGRSGERRLDA